MITFLILKVGVWISPDPARQFHGLYSYTGNGTNPINAVDPDGNEIVETENFMNDKALQQAKVDFIMSDEGFEIWDKLVSSDLVFTLDAVNFENPDQLGQTLTNFTRSPGDVTSVKLNFQAGQTNKLGTKLSIQDEFFHAFQSEKHRNNYYQKFVDPGTISRDKEGYDHKLRLFHYPGMKQDLKTYTNQ